ncbi:MAG: iron-only hydrogenase system regulator [Eubacteriaceae bacterium]|jgi:putative iron-only hydrogenase system regulator|nr:iron-only hydrogenase system regulator [Eubacteriaceae bacterium]
MDDNRIAQIGIMVEDPSIVGELNALLHAYAPYILGRMGIPCRDRGVSVISLIVDAPQNIISALSGKLGMLNHVTAKTLYSKK